MNLQQLNQSGQNVWVFVLTAIVSVLITGFIWFCLELFNSVVKFRDQVKGMLRRVLNDKQERQIPRPSITLRVARALGLISEREYDWVFR